MERDGREKEIEEKGERRRERIRRKKGLEGEEVK